ncbi:hypothetical protein L2729_08040 [Shewanella gelidimarina]|uniref:hypothetical protein n=1 Tax=Shewanella gelidimarina TaxID=56813 RepID=UPI00200FFA78|nr:hypothetical protein [Shewanella gelidimarina]MCL1057951.1 hypothetical protein [Shewanella gelidimarina]
MNKVDEFKRHLKFLDHALVMIVALMCFSGVMFIIKSQGSEMSILTMAVTLLLALTLYIFKLLIVGLSHSTLSLLDHHRQAKGVDIRPLALGKVSGFGLCTFCNEYETKNTLLGRYVCSGCYQVFLKVRETSTATALNDETSFGKRRSLKRVV